MKTTQHSLFIAVSPAGTFRLVVESGEGFNKCHFHVTAGHNGAIVDVNVGRAPSCRSWAGHFYPGPETVKMIYQHSQVMIFSRLKFLEALKVHPNIFAWLAILLKVSACLTGGR